MQLTRQSMAKFRSSPRFVVTAVGIFKYNFSYL